MGDSSFLIVNHENGGFRDLFQFLIFDDVGKGANFLDFGEGGYSPDKLFGDSGDTASHRWVIVVSVIARKIIKLIGGPMRLTGYAVEFLLNLLSLNDSFFGLLQRVVQGKVVMPVRGSETFISAIGHIDGRIDLVNNNLSQIKMEIRSLMDLCMMASKLSYENEKVVRNIVDIHWKMHFVAFYNCWNDYQKQMSTQVFVMCDKLIDANLILISFRGTEPFDADDWITDFDYSWYEIPGLGKVHMGFLEALGLGNRVDSKTFEVNLNSKVPRPFILNYSEARVKYATNRASDCVSGIFPAIEEITAYYAVRNMVKNLLKQHRNAKIMVTGHSLGGALAVLFPAVLMFHKDSEVMQQLVGICTFGQPRVGNSQFSQFMEAHLEHPECKYFRVVYSNDLVPRLPYDDKTFLYKHFGRCMYYDSLYVEHDVEEEPNRNYFGLRYIIPEYLISWWELFRSLIMSHMFGTGYKESWESFLLRVVGLVIPGLSNHSPVDYINSIRLGTT